MYRDWKLAPGHAAWRSQGKIFQRLLDNSTFGGILLTNHGEGTVSLYCGVLP